MPNEKIKINDNERRVLTYMGNHLEEDHAARFKYIAEDIGMDVKLVRRSCRSMARKGLTVFMRGLFDDDGMVAGSGYGLTEEGRELAASINATLDLEKENENA